MSGGEGRQKGRRCPEPLWHYLKGLIYVCELSSRASYQLIHSNVFTSSLCSLRNAHCSLVQNLWKSPNIFIWSWSKAERWCRAKSHLVTPPVPEFGSTSHWITGDFCVNACCCSCCCCGGGGGQVIRAPSRPVVWKKPAPSPLPIGVATCSCFESTFTLFDLRLNCVSCSREASQSLNSRVQARQMPMPSLSLSPWRCLAG